MWGAACYGALGNAEFVVPKYKGKRPMTTMHRPSRCAAVELLDVKDVACGYGFTIFAVNDKKYGHLMGTGINKDGQIGKEKISILNNCKIYSILSLDDIGS